MEIILLDGLNFLSKFQSKRINFWDLEAMISQVKRTVDGFKGSGYDLRVFIDACRFTPEAKQKQTSRIATKIRKEKETFMPFKETLLGDIFKLHGVPVYYSVRADNDDTLASFAQKYSASILSQDQDFFRYIGREFPVYSDYKLTKKGLVRLTLAKPPLHKNIKQRLIIDEPHTWSGMPCCVHWASGEQVFSSPTPLLKQFGNPFFQTRVLRQALYARLQIPQVIETIPVWRNEAVEWVTEVVYPDSTYDHLLANPKQAMLELLKDYLVRTPEIEEMIWGQHLFGLHCIVLECAAVSRNTSLLTLLRPIAQEYMRVKPPDYIKYDCYDCKAKVVVDETKSHYRYLQKSKEKRCPRCHWQYKMQNAGK